jgi:hypothetical protein
VLTSQDERFIISSIGWVDGGSLWILDTQTGTTRVSKLSDAKYLSIHARWNEHFAVLHHYDTDTIEITAHLFSEPEKIISKIGISGTGIQFDGDLGIWSMLPKAYVGYLKRPVKSDFYLFLIEPTRPHVEIVDLEWYDDSYDKGYQGVIGVVEVPDMEQVIISVQRNSLPVLYDLQTRHVLGNISLANRTGNPTLRFRKTANELWAIDYDTLLRLDPADWKVRDSTLLQGASGGLDRQFVGDFAFNKDESLCAVARPFSGDVVALDTDRFRITHRCELGEQPLTVAVLSDGRIYCRDWKTGKLLNGTLKKKWFS